MRVPSFSALLTLLTCTLTFLPSATAIFQDEAGVIDFHHALIGRPLPGAQNLFFHAPSLSSPATLLYTLTERDVVAAIDPSNGEIVWRHLLGEYAQTESRDGSENSEHGILRTIDGLEAVVTALRGHLAVWNAASGRPLWEKRFDGAVTGVSCSARSEAACLVAVSRDNTATLYRLDARTGAQIWEKTIPGSSIPVDVVFSQVSAKGSTSSPTSKVYFLSLHSKHSAGYRLSLAYINPNDGTISKAVDLSNAVPGRAALYVSHKAAPYVVWADGDADGNVAGLSAIALGAKEVQTLSVSNSVLGRGVDELIILPGETSFAVWSGEGADVERFQFSADFETVQKVEAKETAVSPAPGGYVLTSCNGKEYLGRISAVGIELTGLQSQSPVIQDGAQIPGLSVFQPSTFVSAIEAIANDPSRPDSLAMRAAVVTDSGDILLVQDSKIQWSRPESLAGVVHAVFAAVPEYASLVQELAAETHANPLAAYIHRVQRHVRDLVHVPGWLATIPSRMLRSLAGLSVPEIELANSFGFRRYIIVATDKGRVAALDNAVRGSVIWSTQVIPHRQGTKWDVSEILVHNNTVAIAAAGGEIVEMDVLEGTVRNQMSPGSIEQLDRFVQGPSSDPLDLFSLLKDGRPGPLNNPGKTKHITVVSQTENGGLTGWRRSPDGFQTATWEFLPADGSEIVSLAHRAEHDPVAQIGKALGDRNVLYKYLSKNTVLVITQNTAESSITVYLLDTTTGSVLYTTTHHNVSTSQPIESLMSENRFAYTFFQEDSPLNLTASIPAYPKSPILVVSETYESLLANTRGPNHNPQNTSSPLSSLDTLGTPYAPSVLSITFALPHPLSHLSVTSTSQGITPRSLLAYSPQHNSILSIPSAFLNARRPIGRDPTAQEREEGLFAYKPLLELPPQLTLSHDYDIRTNDKIISAPSKMESTSVVFAYGELDLYGTRVAPIGQFDVLGKKFDRLQLVGTVCLLALGTAYLAPMVRKRQAEMAWKA